MNVENNVRTVLCDVFNETRTLTTLPHAETDGYLFQTEDNEIVYADTILSDEFGVDELVHYIDIAEKLYDEYDGKVNIYLICSENVKITVSPSSVSSKADFCIKLSQAVNLIQTALDTIKEKVGNEEHLTRDDIKALDLLPLFCKDDEKTRIRKECLKILQKVDR